MRAYTLIAVLLLQGSVSAWAADVGMITQISGDVSITAGGRVQAAVPFYKVNAGDRMTLGSTARLQVVYFGNGRQEIWSGTGQVEVGNLESKSTINPQVSQLPPLVINQLAKTPAAGQNGKAGMIRVRSLAKPDAAHLDKQYKELKSTVVSGDTTPEVFLLSGLIEMKEFSRAKEVLADLGSKSGYKAVIDHFSPIVAAGMPK